MNAKHFRMYDTMVIPDEYSDDKGIAVQRDVPDGPDGSTSSQAASSNSTRNDSTSSSLHSLRQTGTWQRRTNHNINDREDHAANRENFFNGNKVRFSSLNRPAIDHSYRESAQLDRNKERQQYQVPQRDESMKLVWFILAVLSVIFVIWMLFGRSGVHISGNTGSTINAAGRDLHQ